MKKRKVPKSNNPFFLWSVPGAFRLVTTTKEQHATLTAKNSKSVAQQCHAREEAKHKTKDKRRQGEHSPNQDRTKPTYQTKQKGGQEGTEPHGGTQKDPHHTAASGSKSQCGAQGQRAQETKRQKRDNKTALLVESASKCTAQAFCKPEREVAGCVA